MTQDDYRTAIILAKIGQNQEATIKALDEYVYALERAFNAIREDIIFVKDEAWNCLGDSNPCYSRIEEKLENIEEKANGIF